ncbi:MAG TPA: sigma-54 dependent transcriptional regulator [Longimicrobiaceae bacterium]
MATLTVLTASDSFSSVWEELAASFGCELRVVTAAAEAHRPDSLACILSVPGREDQAETELRALAAAGVDRVLVVGARPEHRLAVAILHAGAADYFALPGDIEPLRAAIAERRRRVDSRDARESLARVQRESFDFSRIIGHSPQLRAALERAAKIIPHDRAAVLITGETGTGKELLAQAIHYNGPRAAAPFVEINCAAIPGTLLEAELFGHERGAFTDARTAKPGLFEIADGGTLFLDEIGHLPFELQGKILKAIEEKKIRRVGAVGVREVDVRVIAATHRDLAAAVREGNFREDLYYRLNVIPIQLPPLRERGDDVLLLAAHFIRQLAAQYGLPEPPLTNELRGMLLSHPWPGNVRELRNSLERALLLGDGRLEVSDLFAPPTQPQSTSSGIPFPASLADIERAAARTMLDRLQGNKKAAADALGISRSRLYRLLEPVTTPEG